MAASGLLQTTANFAQEEKAAKRNRKESAEASRPDFFIILGSLVTDRETCWNQRKQHFNSGMASFIGFTGFPFYICSEVPAC